MPVRPCPTCPGLVAPASRRPGVRARSARGDPFAVASHPLCDTLPAQIFFAGQKGLALSFQNGDLDFFSGPKGASPPNSPHSPGASGSRPAEGRLVLILLEAACRRSPPHPSASPRTPRESRENLLVPPVKKGVVGGGKKSSVYA